MAAVCLASLHGLLARADPAPPARVTVSVRQAVGNATPGKIALRISGATTRFLTPVLVRQSGDQPIPSQKFLGQLFAADGVTPVDGAVKLDNVPPLPAQDVPVGAVVDITLPGDQPGHFVGQLYAVTNDGLPPVCTFEIDRYPPPSLHFVGTSKDGQLALKTTRRAFTRDLLIEPTSAAAIDGLQIEAGPLVASDGEAIPLTVTPGGRITPPPSPGAPTRVTLRADLPRATEYTTDLRLSYGGRVESTHLTLTRAQRTQPVKVLAISAGRGEIGPFTGSDVPLWMTLHAADGGGDTVASVTLAGLGLKRKEAFVRAEYQGAVVTLDDNGAAATSFEVTPQNPRPVTVRLQDVREAGEYKATVRVAPLDADPFDQDVVVLVRERWWVAVFLIVVGVVLSTLVALYTRFSRPRLQQQRTLLEFDDNATVIAKRLAPFQGEEGEIFAHQKSRLDDLWSRVARQRGTLGDVILQDPPRPQPDLWPALTDAGEKLRLFEIWAAVSREVAGLSETLQAKFAARLSTAADYLRSDALSASSQFDTQRDALAKLQSEIGPAVRDEIDQTLDAMRLDAEARRDSSDTADQEAWNQIVASIKKLRAETDIQKLRADFPAVNAAYVRALAREFERALNTQKQPPGFSTAEEWNKFKTQVIAELHAADPQDADAAREAYEDAFGHYLREAAARLGDVMKLQREKWQSNSGLNADRKQTLLDRLDEQAAKAGGVPAKLREGKLQEANTDYREAAEAFSRMADGAEESAAEEAAPQVTRFFGPTVEKLLPLLRGQDAKAARPSLGRLTWKLGGLDKLVWVCISVFTILLGMELFYVDAPTWGGLGDYLKVLLWGFGLHQVSTATPLQGGLLGVRAAFRPASA